MTRRSSELGLVVLLAVLMALSVGYLVAKAVAHTIPRCAEDEHVTPDFTCVNDGQADYRGGYWYWQDAGTIPPLTIEKGEDR